VIRLLLVVVALLPGCTLLDGVVRYTDRAMESMVGEREVPKRDPLYLHLQLAMLSDATVSQLVQVTEPALNEASDINQRELLLHLRLDYAAALWSAASGPNPYANAINMMLTLAVAQQVVARSAVSGVLGTALQPTLDVLASAEEDAAGLVRTFVDPVQYEALRAEIDAQADTSVAQRGLGAVDLEKLLRGAGGRAGPSAGPTSLLRIFGMDPFTGLDPATREIAESRQFGERLLFNLQRMPFLIRLNGELLANDVAQDLDLDRIITSLERASLAMSQVASTAATLPGQMDQQRVRLVADVRAEAERLGTLARDYRSAFEAASVMAVSTDQALRTFAGVVDRFEPAAGAPTTPSRPFDIAEYTQTAASVSQAATTLSGLLAQVDTTLASPGLSRMPELLTAVLDEADGRSRRLLYTGFALGCGLIALSSVAVILTATVLRRRGALGSPRTTAP